VDPASATQALADSVQSLADLSPTGRATLAPEDASAFEPFARWSDGPPFAARRALGRGEAWVTTLPFAVEASDLTLRPAFLALLDAWIAEARLRASPRRTDIALPWTFPGARDLQVEGPAGPLATSREHGVVKVVPTLLGAYRISVDGRTEVRVAAPLAREIDLRPRRVAPATGGSALGERHASVDVSWFIALALLGLTTVELLMRVYARTQGVPT
jgi:hypothetical protein